jgi:hypothetical protein
VRRRRRRPPRLIPRRWLVRAFGAKRDYPRRFSRALAIAITLASALAATAAWRAEDRARVGEEQDRAGFAQDVARSAQKASIRANVLLRESEKFVRMIAAQELASALSDAADQLKGSPDGERLQAQADAQSALARQLKGVIESDAFAGGHMTFDTLKGTLARELRFSGTEQDLVSADEFARSNGNFDRSNLEVVVALIALLAAFALTVAQLTARPRAVALSLLAAFCAFGAAAGWLIQLEFFA